MDYNGNLAPLYSNAYTFTLTLPPEITELVNRTYL